MWLSNKMRYLRLNHKKFHVDIYEGLQDAIPIGDNNIVAIRQRIILPSSFTGVPRHMV
jgi:hypothetical protein